MDNSVVRDVTRRLKELEADLAACAAQLADAEAAHETIARKVENYRGMLADYSQWEGATTNRRLRSEDLHDIMAKILDEVHVPLHYKVIYEKLLDYGIQVPGEDPVKNTGAHLSSDSQFVSMGQGEWALAKWQGNVGVDDSVPATDEKDDLPF